MLYNAIKLLLFVVSCIGFPLSLHALSLDEVVKFALNNSYQIANQQHLLESTQLAQKSQHTLFMPSVSLGYTFNYRAPQNRLPYSSNTLDITGSWNLFNGMQDFYTYKQLGTDIKIQANNLDSIRNDIVLNTKTAYIKVLENKEALKIAQDSIKLLELQHKQATQFYIHGINDKSAVLSFEVKLANAKIEQTQVQIALNYNLDLLQKLTGQPLTLQSLQDIQVQEGVSYAKDQLLNEIYAKNPQMHFLQLTLERGEYDKKIAQGKYYPQFDISASKYWYLTGANTSIVNFGLQSQVTLDINWNLFDSYTAFFSTQSKQANLLALNSQILDLRKDIATEVSSLLNSLEVAKEQYNLAKIAINQAEENYRIVSNRYQQNIANYIELLNAELLLTNAKSSLVTARYEIALNIAKIEHLKNQHF